jgi:hypothetical protein
VEKAGGCTGLGEENISFLSFFFLEIMRNVERNWLMWLVVVIAKCKRSQYGSLWVWRSKRKRGDYVSSPIFFLSYHLLLSP